ncbi:MAG: hypothetical protein A3B68_08330 [Candidatus Melainabacteria bacterium RIFCSPHIGHO2_02_FULL_34_12]|nr:MAG: hypothetical protein A3B68_08330 [Candidatus Melainabacteria bacterium RIFCSPHIGHO2_02_FULL_34_12]
MTAKKNIELIRQIGMNPAKPDSFQLLNEPLMNNLLLWSQQKIDLRDTVLNFFTLNVRTKLVAILLDLDLNNWIGIGASWQYNNQNGQIRIDARLTEYLLNNAFGVSPVNQPFNIKNINQLELNLLQGFLSNIETKLKDLWEVDPKYPYLADLIYMVWLIESDEGEIGRIAYAVPASLKPKLTGALEAKEGIDLNKLANTGIKVPINLKVGTTRLSITEIKSFEHGDLIVFEESDISKLIWHLGEITIVLPEEDHPIFLKDIENIEELAEEMVKSTHNIDDDPLSSLPLELSAEFQKVFIPLKQVLDLKAGGVLPLGTVLDSELVLTAQGKPIAKGELVIVGNQFGMRITELFIGAKKFGKGSTVEINDILSPETQMQQPKSNPKKQSTSFADELKGLEDES